MRLIQLRAALHATHETACRGAGRETCGRLAHHATSPHSHPSARAHCPTTAGGRLHTLHQHHQALVPVRVQTPLGLGRTVLTSHLLARGRRSGAWGLRYNRIRSGRGTTECLAMESWWVFLSIVTSPPLARVQPGVTLWRASSCCTPLTSAVSLSVLIHTRTSIMPYVSVLYMCVADAMHVWCFSITTPSQVPDSDPTTTSAPHDLTPSERVRLATEMLTGFRWCRLALGLYLRGLTAGLSILHTFASDCALQTTRPTPRLQLILA